MALIIGVVIVLLILFGFLCYKKAPPTEAIVVTGFGLARPKVVCGKGTFVLPVLQRADRLNMRLLKIDVKTPETGVKTQNGVSLWIDSVVTIQVYCCPRQWRDAAKQTVSVLRKSSVSAARHPARNLWSTTTIVQNAIMTMSNKGETP